METVEKRIWDLPVRISHWGLAISFAGAYITAELNLTLHEIFAFLCLFFVVFRVMWGLVGSQTARFTSFVRGFAAIKQYTFELLKFRHKEYWGHNPLGALAVLVILGLMAVLVIAGLFIRDDGFVGPWALSVSRNMSGFLGEAHEVLANILLGVVLFHIAAILAYKVLLRDNLITPMVKGTRKAAADFVEPKFAPIWLAVILAALALAITGAIFRLWLL
ncbi:MAG: cytochrome b/b6 domain-containing protein [Rhodobacteraceae bacterium]|nr:cytochrome b/b6 domain-containing protein [Paracoccaceae bacterium]